MSDATPINVGNGPSPFLTPDYAPVQGTCGTSYQNWTFGGAGNYPRPFTSFTQRVVEASNHLGPFAIRIGDAESVGDGSLIGILSNGTIAQHFGGYYDIDPEKVLNPETPENEDALFDESKVIPFQLSSDTVEEISETSLDELSGLQGFDSEIASELQSRALSHVRKERKRFEDAVKKLKIEEDLIQFPLLSETQIIILGENNIKNKESLADLDSSELLEILESTDLKSEEDAGKIIMQARAHWFIDENNQENEEVENEVENQN